MPPKKKEKSSSENDVDKANMAAGSTGLEEFLDQRLKLQLEQMNVLFAKFTKSTKNDLEEVNKRQSFLSVKFEEVITSVAELKQENKALRTESSQLRERIKLLECQVAESESDTESIKQYLRRDLIKIHGVPFNIDEDTNRLVKGVVELADPSLKLDDQDISISHRLPASTGFIAPIIAKFTRRDVRDRIMSMKKNLQHKSARDLGFTHNTQLYINESLTPNCRILLKEVKHFKRSHNFKYVWFRQGKIYLRKDESSPVFRPSNSHTFCVRHTHLTYFSSSHA
jgi:cell division protein FtsB